MEEKNVNKTSPHFLSFIPVVFVRFGGVQVVIELPSKITERLCLIWHVLYPCIFLNQEFKQINLSFEPDIKSIQRSVQNLWSSQVIAM